MLLCGCARADQIILFGSARICPIVGRAYIPRTYAVAVSFVAHSRRAYILILGAHTSYFWVSSFERAYILCLDTRSIYPAPSFTSGSPSPLFFSYVPPCLLAFPSLMSVACSTCTPFRHGAHTPYFRVYTDPHTSSCRARIHLDLGVHTSYTRTRIHPAFGRAYILLPTSIDFTFVILLLLSFPPLPSSLPSSPPSVPSARALQASPFGRHRRPFEAPSTAYPACCDSSLSFRAPTTTPVRCRFGPRTLRWPSYTATGHPPALIYQRPQTRLQPSPRDANILGARTPALPTIPLVLPLGLHDATSIGVHVIVESTPLPIALKVHAATDYLSLHPSHIPSLPSILPLPFSPCPPRALRYRPLRHHLPRP
ncbi:hypothetical protein C8R47DRAFT_69563 [Mycena vitilis]|nr:hypothetical protein C8R47DRAFT_69563 [Mycena vitilis]